MCVLRGGKARESVRSKCFAPASGGGALRCVLGQIFLSRVGCEQGEVTFLVEDFGFPFRCFQTYHRLNKTMPRARDRADKFDDTAAPSPRRRGEERSSMAKLGDLSTEYIASHTAALQPAPLEDPQLIELENRLNDEVDEDFFEDPRRFNTLPRVIDVLGIQMIDDATLQQESYHGLKKNPAYKQLQAQQQVVEDAIEHLAVIHCADLNASVIKVGRVARQLSQAVSKVRGLRKQVKDIQDSLGTQSAGPSQSLRKSKNGTTTTTTATALSLRELWLKKLECEATLALLSQLDVLRAAPAQFDQFVTQGRIGAGVLQISTALQTMFQENVAQVQALHKIMEQLMIRKQKAEEIIWESLKHVIYLRTGNAVFLSKSRVASQTNKAIGQGTSVAGASVGPMGGGHSVSSESRLTTNSGPRTGGKEAAAAAASMAIRHNGMVNPFINAKHLRSDEDLGNSDDISVASSGSQASLFSLEDGEAEEMSKMTEGDVTSLARKNVRRLMVPIPLMEAELDLEADERRCQEDLLLQGLPCLYARHLPRFADPVVALRILVESLYQLKRLDDVERVIQENLEAEVRYLVQRQQSLTFSLLENTSNVTDSDFRRHLTGLLSCLGSVLVRLSHLAQIVRFRIVSGRSEWSLWNKNHSFSPFFL